MPPIISACGPLIKRYDVLFSDIWGVVHDGLTAIPAANATLPRFRAEGGTVILITNAPQPEERVAEILDERRVRRDAWDAIVSSGELALGHIRAQGYRSVHHIGPESRSRPLLAKLPRPATDLADAEAIVCSGLIDDRRETAANYRPLLDQALARRLPFVCANPDLAVHVGADLLPCAGAIGALYAEMGGAVHWAGKPYAAAYDDALAKAAAIRGQVISRQRVLAIGDALRTDLAGAKAAGIDALFIATGIHRDETMEGGAIVPAKLRALFAASAPPAIAAAVDLAW